MSKATRNQSHRLRSLAVTGGFLDGTEIGGTGVRLALLHYWLPLTSCRPLATVLFHRQIEATAYSLGRATSG